MNWAYGITTVPERFKTTFLRTLASLTKAGFDKPRLFVDGGDSLDMYKPLGLEVIHRVPRIRTTGNWMLGLYELYIRNPTAERFAMFQDDFITCIGLKEYLTRAPYPHRGYLNLYTFPSNQVLAGTKRGFFESNQLGYGAVALVFSREAVLTLLKQPYMVDRFADVQRGHKCLDGGIVSAMKNAGWKEFTHNPSLTQHTGQASSMGNPSQPQSPSFPGEEFDARQLLGMRTEQQGQPVPVVAHEHPAVAVMQEVQARYKRVGLVGYNCESGLGILNRQIAQYASIDRWLVKPHEKFGVGPLSEDVQCTVCPIGNKVDEFVRSVDVVLFAETPYYSNLIPLCKKYGRKVVCIPMIEWTPPRGTWIDDVTQFVCPTYQGYEMLRQESRADYFAWPVDTARFKFHKRVTCRRFLFINGHGGYKGRKGFDVLSRARQLWPEIPVSVFSQVPIKWNPVQISPKNNADLYNHGDVLICPHTVDGIGLEPLEASASGVPSILTQGNPWDEYPAIARISAVQEERKIARVMPWYIADAEKLVEACQMLLGKDISQASCEARTWAESRSWTTQAEAFDRLIRS